ncbi:MAG: enoyl-CoA hydratase-related protein [Proteobacteria bacterium]|nr:enoyl-CoA hydratase/isomerase family protein [Betaproteobacteria bacterium]MCX7136957.1 enoyl-CoA hydratase-related protein [Pseudomonadota bacterium]
MSITVTKNNGIATVLLDRADKLNALSGEMYHDLADAFLSLANDDEARCVVVTGAGRAFCAGGDVGSMGDFDVVSGRKRSQGHHQMIKALHNLEKPVIASVRGPAAGIGASIALACDLIIASETAYLLMAFKNVGIPPDGGAIFLLTQHLGIARAKELVYTARKLPAAEAKEMGLVVKVVPDGELEAATQALAAEIASSATYALRLAKKMFQSMYTPTLETLLELENTAVCGARLTHDHKEGIAAFKEKRKAKFEGR